MTLFTAFTASSPNDIAGILNARALHARLPPFALRFADGSVHRIGSSGDPQFTLEVRTPRGGKALAMLDELAIGEAYLRGDLDLTGDFLACLDLRGVLGNRHPVHSLLRFVVPVLLGQRRGDFEWVPRHYDFGNDFYFAFLDRWVGLYSQALYTSDCEPLEQAVRNKLDYIVEICRLRQGSHILDVGGGWGALEKYIGTKGINSTMLTLSKEQFAHLSDWTTRHGMPCQLDVAFESIFSFDPGITYDAITLLGVMEHLPAYERLFTRFAKLLKPGGRVYMDFAAGAKKFDVSAFTYRHVFPGNHTPVYLPGLLEGAIRNGFEPIALHNDRHSYFLTLQAWARNLEAAHDTVVPMVGEQVYRLFRLYLWGGAHQLERSGSLQSYRVVFQKSVGRSSSEIGPYKPV